MSISLVQGQTEFTVEKAATVNFGFSPRLVAEIGSEYRNTLTENLGVETLQSNTKHAQISGNIAYEIGFYAKLGGGVMYRFNTLEDSGNENEIRLTQQYTYANPLNALRIGHRLKLDQRIRTSRTTYRVRYRFSADVPLSGLSLDLGEFYAVANTESIVNFGALETPAWDQRLTVGLGNQLFKNIKLQLDIQYRVEDYFKTSKNRLFVVTQVYYKI